jgi:hypothetical protein
MIMKRKTLISILFYLSLNFGFSQNDVDGFPDFTKPTKMDSVKRMDVLCYSELEEFRIRNILDSATLSLCDNDTTKTIDILTRFAMDYKNTGMDKLVNLRIGQLYFDKGDIFLAHKKYKEVIESEEINFPFLVSYGGSFEIQKCEEIVSFSDYRKIKYLTCLSAFKAAMFEKDYFKAYQMLILVEYTHFPKQIQCGNEYQDYRHKLNRCFIEYYLKVEDFGNALSRAKENSSFGFGWKQDTEMVEHIRNLKRKKRK